MCEGVANVAVCKVERSGTISLASYRLEIRKKKPDGVECMDPAQLLNAGAGLLLMVIVTGFSRWASRGVDGGGGGDRWIAGSKAGDDNSGW